MTISYCVVRYAYNVAVPATAKQPPINLGVITVFDLGLWPERVFEPVVGEDGEVFEVNPVVTVQIGRGEKGQVENAGAVGSCINNLRL